MYLCSLCNNEYPENVEKCPLEHCRFCGDTSLEIVSAKIFRDPIFILINTLFAMLVVWSAFNREYGSSENLLVMGVFFYIIGLAAYISAMDRRSVYNCKNCRTIVKNPLTDVEIGKFDQKPVKKEVIQNPLIPKTHHVKEIIMIVGSIGSIAGLVLFFLARQSSSS